MLRCHKDRRTVCLLAAACALVLSHTASAEDALSLETQVAVVLARNCLECHNASDHKGGLDLTRREKALAGGDSGVVLQAGEPDKSPLLGRLDADEMPPEGRTKLTADERKLVREWITAGAKWAADPDRPVSRHERPPRRLQLVVAATDCTSAGSGSPQSKIRNPQ